nr:GAF domain-containing protein [Conchiformibius kuhniae]
MQSGTNRITARAVSKPPACTRIAKGRGVCGQAWSLGQTVLVDDVAAHPDHIACSSRARSEIVVPVRHRNGQIAGVLDVDSEQLAAFDRTDALWLERLCALIGERTALPL